LPVLIEAALKELRSREMEPGGFPLKRNGAYQPDATAWAVIALEAAGVTEEGLMKARERLVASQENDGRVVFSSRLSAAYWATPVAVLSWIGSPHFKEARQKSAAFLLSAGGHHESMIRDPVFGHDLSLRGWPWIEGTHSWIEPTSLTLLALRACGRNHERMTEAVALIMDRQLGSGGWNYGNTTVFGTELWPIPECTGVALNALSGLVPENRIACSIEYMKASAACIRTPLALAWGILGLDAWDQRPARADEWILESLSLQNRYGVYDTTLLGQLLTAYHARGGILGLFRGREPGR